MENISQIKQEIYSLYHYPDRVVDALLAILLYPHLLIGTGRALCIEKTQGKIKYFYTALFMRNHPINSVCWDRRRKQGTPGETWRGQRLFDPNGQRLHPR